MEKNLSLFDTSKYSTINKPVILGSKGNGLLEFPTNYVVVDIETTGLNPRKDEIIELSALKFVDNKLVDSYSTLVKPLGEVSYFVTRLTGITIDMLKDAPEIAHVLPEFLEFVGEEIVVGHNIGFDIGFIDRSTALILNRRFGNDFVDTVRLARQYCPKLSSYKLSVLANYFRIDSKGAHRGLKDCQMAQELLENLRKLARK